MRRLEIDLVHKVFHCNRVVWTMDPIRVKDLRVTNVGGCVMRDTQCLVHLIQRLEICKESYENSQQETFEEKLLYSP